MQPDINVYVNAELMYLGLVMEPNGNKPFESQCNDQPGGRRSGRAEQPQEQMTTTVA